LFNIKHELFSLLIFVGMRDRLRCPKCKAVGTWKPHGAWFLNSKESGRRWLCKWCGYYLGRPFNQKSVIKDKAFVDLKLECWRLKMFYKPPRRPRKSLIPKEFTKKKTGYDMNPWRG